MCEDLSSAPEQPGDGREDSDHAEKSDSDPFGNWHLLAVWYYRLYVHSVPVFGIYDDPP